MVYGHTTTAMHDIEYTSPPSPLRIIHSARLLKLVELSRFPVVPSPPLHESQLAPRDRLAGILAHPLNLLPHGDQVVGAPLDAIFDHRHLASV